MPHSPHHRQRGPDQTRDRDHGRPLVPAPDADGEPELLVPRAHDLSLVQAGTLTRVDGGSRARLTTALQRTLGNAHVQRLIAGLSQRSSQIDRCGGMPCHTADEEGVQRVQRLGQAPDEIFLPRGASLASPAMSPRQDEEERRPPAH